MGKAAVVVGGFIVLALIFLFFGYGPGKCWVNITGELGCEWKPVASPQSAPDNAAVPPSREADPVDPSETTPPPRNNTGAFRAWNYDTNGDGVYDATGYDTDLNGRVNSMLYYRSDEPNGRLFGFDTQEDGFIDHWGFDTKGTGRPDTWAWDSNMNGAYDTWAWDTDANGRSDLTGYDPNEDRVIDRYERV